MVRSTAKEAGELPMAHEITNGTILIKDNALLPKGLRFESEPCVPGWKLVKDFDGYQLDREIQKTGWTFFCLAGEIKATVFGMDEQGMVRRAIERILTNPRSEGFNSLEIMRVASVGSERFPLIHYLTVSARSRHIQESLFLGRAADHPGPKTRKSGLHEFPSDSTGAASAKTRLSQEPVKETHGISVLSQ